MGQKDRVGKRGRKRWRREKPIRPLKNERKGKHKTEWLTRYIYKSSRRRREEMGRAESDEVFPSAGGVTVRKKKQEENPASDRERGTPQKDQPSKELSAGTTSGLGAEAGDNLLKGWMKEATDRGEP